MGRLAKVSVIVGILNGAFAGVLAGVATDVIVARMRHHKNGKLTWHVGYGAGLGTVGAMGFTAWLLLVKFVDTDTFLPSYFLFFMATYLIVTFRVILRFVRWVGDTI